MKKKTIIGIIILVFTIVAVLIVAMVKGKVVPEGTMILCSGVEMIDNKKDGSLTEYNGYYVQEEYLTKVINDNRQEIEKICKGKFDTKFYIKGRDCTYIVFKDKGKKSAFIIFSDEEGNHVIACEGVGYSIKYPKGSKGNISDFWYDNDTALEYIVK